MRRTGRVIDSHWTGPIAGRGGQAISVPIANDLAGRCHAVGESYSASRHNEEVCIAVHSAAEPHLWAGVYRQVAVVENTELKNRDLIVMELAAQVNFSTAPGGCGRIQPPAIPQRGQPIVRPGRYGHLCRAWRWHRSDGLGEIITGNARYLILNTGKVDSCRIEMVCEYVVEIASHLFKTGLGGVE